MNLPFPGLNIWTALGLLRCLTICFSMTIALGLAIHPRVARAQTQPLSADPTPASASPPSQTASTSEAQTPANQDEPEAQTQSQDEPEAQTQSQDEPDSRTNVTVKTKRQSLKTSDLPLLAQLTLEHSPLVRKAKGELEIATLEKRNAEVTSWPSLDVDTTYGYQDTHPTGKSPWSPYASGLNLVMTENLYDNGANMTRLKLAKSRFETARLDYEQQRDQALLNMTQAFYDWSASIRQREIDENKRDLLRRQFKVLETQYRQGLKTRRDVLRIETEVRRLEIGIISRDNEVDLNFQRLAGTVGMGNEELGREDFEMEEVKPYASIEGNPPELKATEHRRAKILNMVRSQADLESRLVERDRLPQIFVTGAAGYHMANYVDDSRPLYQDTSYNWEALLTLRYNLWDFGTRQRNVEIAHVRAANIGEDNRQILLDLSNELRDVWNKQREYLENVRLSRELLVLEQQSYNVLETEYRNGRANYLDLIGSLNSLIDARSKFASSYYGLKKQQMIYAFHKGNIYETLQ